MTGRAAIRAAGAGLALLLAAGAVRAQEPGRVDLRVVPDRIAPGDSITVGDSLWVTVVSRGPTGWALLPESVVAAYRPWPEVAVLGTDRRDGQLRLKIALFRPGDVVLPTVDARVLTADGDTVAAPIASDTIHVASVLAPGDTTLADIKPMWTETTTPWWVWAALAAAVLAVLALLWWRRRRRRKAAAAPVFEPHPDAAARARARIERALAGATSPPERVAAAGEVGEALRDYLADGWGIAARERTTFELLGGLPEPVASHRAALGSALSVVDLAKFARVDPGAEGLRDLAARGLAVLDALEEARRAPAEPAAAPEREAAS